MYLDEVPVKIERTAPGRGGVILKLATIDDRTAAQRLQGGVLTVPLWEVKQRPEGFYYHYQISGAEVWNEDGEQLGWVAEILTAPGNDIYVVRKEDCRDLLLPALRNVVLDVDLSARLLKVRVPEGLE